MDYRPLEEIKENQSSHEVHKSVEGFELEEDDLNDLDNGNGFEYKAYTYSDADRSMRTITHKATDNEKLALKSSPFHAALNIYRASLGTAFLAVPYLANLVGWKIFLLSIVMAVATTLYGTHMLLAVADSLGYYGSSYDKMLAFVFKKRWPMHVVKVVIVISQMLGAIGNNLFIIDMLVYVFCEQGFFSQFCKPRLVYVLASFILSAPIYLIINLKYFSYVSLISTLVASIILLMLALQSTEHLFQPQELRLHQRDGVHFDKGCYLGQEIVARLWFKAKPKHWLHLIQGKDTVPSPASQLSKDVEVVNSAACEDGYIALVIAKPVALEELGVKVLDLPEVLNGDVDRKSVV